MVDTVGVDVGASKVVAGVVAPDGKTIQRVERRRTPSSESSGLADLLIDMVEELRADVPSVAGIGVGAAGLVLWPSGEIEHAVNHTHRRLRVRPKLARGTGLPVVVDNDANAAAWGESRERVGESVLFVAIGTGLGSGFVDADGTIMRGPGGRGAELGHVVVRPDDGPPCSCGQRGCLEAVASGRALSEWARTHLKSSPTGPLARVAAGPGVTSVSTKHVITAAQLGDRAVLLQVRRMSEAIGVAVARNAMSLFPVDRVVVGGGLSVLGDAVLQPMRSACGDALARHRYLRPPRFSPATHGEDAILVGAALMAQEDRFVSTPAQPDRGEPVDLVPT